MSNVKGFHGQIKRQTLYYVDTLRLFDMREMGYGSELAELTIDAVVKLAR
jgi:hypothetical protein